MFLLTETPVVPQIQTDFITALGTVSDTILDFLGAALPIAMGIAGTVLAVKFGWSLIKQIKG